MGLSKLKLPDNICDIDDRINHNRKYASNSNNNISTSHMAKTTQFGVTLKFIVTNSPCLNSIPPIVRKCVDSLSITGMIDTEGIFRRSGNHSEIIALKERVNRGEDVDLKDVNVHVIAGLLKSFLRDLSEPLLTFELYDEITSFLGKLNFIIFFWRILFLIIFFFVLDWPKEDRSRNVTQLIRERLPEENYELFKYIVEFLVRVS